MKSAGRSYFEGAAATSVSTLVSAASGFVSLYFLTRILTKEELGGYAFAFSAVSLLAFVAAWGFERNLMLRIARLAPDPKDLRGRGLVLRAVGVSTLIALVLIVGLYLAAPTVVALGAIPEAELWLVLLVIALVPMAASAQMQAWFRANSRIVTASLTNGAVNLFRALLLAGVFLAGGGVGSVAAAVILSTLAPVLIIGFLGRHARDRPPSNLRLRDAWTGAVMVVQKISNYGLRLVDVILVGFLASGVATAEYAVAARLALFCGMGSEAMQPTFAPRGRRYFATGDLASAAREYHIARAAGFLVSLGVAILLVLLGPRLLEFFGDFDAAFGPLLVLSAGYIVTAGAGFHFSYLQMQGEIWGTTVLRLSGLVVMVALAFLLIPTLAALGGALALTGAIVYLNASSLYYMYRRTGFPGLTRASAALTMLAAILLTAGGLGYVAPVPLAAALTAVGLAAFVIDDHAKAVFRLVIQGLRFAG